jgi:hypothetical protein
VTGKGYWVLKGVNGKNYLTAAFTLKFR